VSDLPRCSVGKPRDKIGDCPFVETLITLILAFFASQKLILPHINLAVAVFVAVLVALTIVDTKKAAVLRKLDTQAHHICRRGIGSLGKLECARDAMTAENPTSVSGTPSTMPLAGAKPILEDEPLTWHKRQLPPPLCR
jgi:hypothetical protein